MGWPPKVGEVLPRAAEAFGIEKKLIGYSLDIAHEKGGPKARGFERILGITRGDVGHLEEAILAGIETVSIDAVRDNAPYGVNCVVDVPVRGLGDKEDRLVNVRTVWELTSREAAPRLVSAYVKP